MANQDYVSRAPVKKKKNTRNGKKPTKNTNTMPLKAKLISVLLVFLIAGFSYGLWSLKTDPDTKTPLVVPVETAKDKKAANKANELPKPPKEKWTYVKDLASKEIEVGKYEVKEKGPYKMQCGSFRTQKQAETLKARIAFAGLEAQVKSVAGKNGTWTKVFLGPYPRKRLAEKDKHMLKRNNINGCQIWLWQ
ncbi:SPOR domain-containing protein [Colwellia psychrerythraea]|uniref:Sporulation domain-containing protein n=1 Tax=Colwellia psychrerythraea TaxID=28229 RepID=A0A099KLN5_COLPS|nr:SPOR domain-containing protein [Colwellia psychrerythraea]KGJ91115.1 Sporulation domain-containing protein [Colwellia psychrerythraea]